MIQSIPVTISLGLLMQILPFRRPEADTGMFRVEFGTETTCQACP